MTGLNKWTVLKVDAKLSVKMPMVPSRNVRLPTSKWTVIISGVNGFRSKWAFIKLKNGQVVFLGSFWPSGLFNLCSKDHSVLSDSTVQFQPSRIWTSGKPYSIQFLFFEIHWFASNYEPRVLRVLYAERAW